MNFLTVIGKYVANLKNHSRSSGGVGWFSRQQLSILHPFCRRVCE